MKKLCILLVCAALLLLSACGNKQEELQEPTNFYYCVKDITYNNPSGVIRAEERESVYFYGNLAYLLRSYLLGPSDSQLQTLIPDKVSLVSCALNEDRAVVILSESFAKLSAPGSPPGKTIISYSFNSSSFINLSAFT